MEKQIERCVEEYGYASKSEFVRDAIRRRIEKLDVVGDKNE